MSDEGKPLIFDEVTKASNLITRGMHPYKKWDNKEKVATIVTPEQIARGDRMRRIEKLNEAKVLREMIGEIG